MKFLKWLLIIIGVLIVLVFVVAALLPGEYRIERSIVIEEEPAVVYEQVVDFNKWEYWEPWREDDPNAEYNVSDPGRGVGAVLSWKGEVVGQGTLTLVEAEEPRLVKSKLVFTEPMESESTDIWTIEPAPGGAEVTWAQEGTLGYPIERYFGIGLEGMIAPEMEKGLENLKRYTESLPEDSVILIDGALSEDEALKDTARAEEMVGDPDVRYETKPYEEARKEAEERAGEDEPLREAKRVDPPR